jgi:hypothetical protein
VVCACRAEWKFQGSHATNARQWGITFYDGEKPIFEYNAGRVITGRNVYGKGIDEILMRADTTANNGQRFYYPQNHEVSVIHLTNASGTVIEKYRFDVFSAPTAYDGTGKVLTGTAYNNRFLFTGDAERLSRRSQFLDDSVR